jgi:phage/plasmid-associated DNA primase
MNRPTDHNSSKIGIKHFVASVFVQDGVKTFLPVNIWFKDKTNSEGEQVKEKCVANSKSSLTFEKFKELKETGETIDKEGKPYYLNKSNGKNKDKVINYANCSHFELSLRANKKIYIIDIDDKTLNWDDLPDCLKVLPYTLSASKNLPHFYFSISDDLDHDALKGGDGRLSLGDDNLNFGKGDLLISHAWENKEGFIYNWDLNKSLPILSFDIVKSMCKEETITRIMETQKPVNTITFKVQEKEEDLADTTEEEIDEEDKTNLPVGVCLIKLPKKAEVVPVAPTKTEEPKAEPKKFEFDKAKTEAKLRLLATCWNDDRLHTWNNWRDFTWAIQNEFIKDTGLTIWDELSKKYGKKDGEDKYNNIKNTEKWNELAKTRAKEGKKVNIGRLVLWAKEDNKEKYDQIFNKVKIDWERLTEFTFAQRLKTAEYLGVNILFTGNSKDMQGFRFNGVYWEDLGLHNSEIKKGYFDKMYSLYMQELEKIEQFLEPEAVMNIKNRIKSLDSAVFRNHVIDILKSEEYIKDVKWNKDNNLFAFEDCIYNLKIGAFVKPDPKQYINWTTGYAYGDTKQQYTEEQEWCKTFLHEILGDAETEKWLLKVMASFCKQENAEEKAHFWLGTGRNGKGTLTKLLSIALGQYFGELNLGYYTQYDKSPDAPNNNLFNLRNARLCNTSEVGEDNQNPDRAIRFITEKFKRITGGDKLVARQPHEKTQIEFIAGKVLIQTNMMPELVGIELEKNISLRERVIICKFPYSFVDDAKLIKSNPNIYKKKDSSLKEKFEDDKLKLGFIRLLLSQFAEYKKPEAEGGGIKETAKVKQYRMEYFDECNKTKIWFDEYLELSNDECKKNDRLNIPTDLFQSFCATNSGTKAIKKALFLDQLTQIVGKISAKENISGVYTASGIAWLQGYKWKQQAEPEPIYQGLHQGLVNSLVQQKKKPVIEDDVESETEEVEYELA